MSDSPRGLERVLRSVEFYAIVLSIGAFLVSGYSVLIVNRQHEDERTAELILALYSNVQESVILRLEHRNIGHVFEMPDAYAGVRDQIRLAVLELPEHERIALLESEKAIAAIHFIQFEEIFYHYSLAVDSGNETRVQVVGDILAYYTMGILRNPRLLWLASPEGGGMASHLNPPSRAYYEAQVLENEDHPLTIAPDPVGVFLSPGS